eukprot:29658-Pelagococcus_subviridis.AAC.3
MNRNNANALLAGRRLSRPARSSRVTRAYAPPPDAPLPKLASISSRLFPFVSGRYRNVNAKCVALTPEKNKNAPPTPTKSDSDKNVIATVPLVSRFTAMLTAREDLGHDDPRDRAHAKREGRHESAQREKRHARVDAAARELAQTEREGDQTRGHGDDGAQEHRSSSLRVHELLADDDEHGLADADERGGLELRRTERVSSVVSRDGTRSRVTSKPRDGRVKNETKQSVTTRTHLRVFGRDARGGEHLRDVVHRRLGSVRLLKKSGARADARRRPRGTVAQEALPRGRGARAGPAAADRSRGFTPRPVPVVAAGAAAAAAAVRPALASVVAPPSPASSSSSSLRERSLDLHQRRARRVLLARRPQHLPRLALSPRALLHEPPRRLRQPGHREEDDDRRRHQRQQHEPAPSRGVVQPLHREVRDVPDAQPDVDGDLEARDEDAAPRRRGYLRDVLRADGESQPDADAAHDSPDEDLRERVRRGDDAHPDGVETDRDDDALDRAEAVVRDAAAERARGGDEVEASDRDLRLDVGEAAVARHR